MRLLLIIAVLILTVSTAAFAHFGAIIPDTEIVSAGDSPALALKLKFLHPLEQIYMDLSRPREFGVLLRGSKIDLLDSLQKVTCDARVSLQDFTCWLSDFTVRRPGDHTFYMVPQPYWEPAEDLFIVHYTKVTVAALGRQDGWGQPVGLETEIVPLSRPYGLWAGNLFSGQVLLKGQPAAYAEVEVEYLNETTAPGRQVKAPADPFITQVIKADSNGVFHYAMPRAGWWGFSALSAADWTLPHAGQQKKVEIGAVFWVHSRDMDED